MGKTLELIKGFGKSLFLNLYYFDLVTALRMPILVGGRVRINALGKRGAVKICGTARTGMIRIGLNAGSFNLGEGRYTSWSISGNGTIEVHDRVLINKGTAISVGKNGELVFRGCFFCNANCVISASEYIEFGEDSLLGWNVTIIDSDGHKIIYPNSIENQDNKVIIGNHVWICSNVEIMKGTNIRNNSVVAMNSHVSRLKTEEDGVLIVNNAIVKTGITWEH